jgi:hypothetical protein
LPVCKHYRFKQLAHKLGGGHKVFWPLSTKHVDKPVRQCHPLSRLSANPMS